MKGENPMYLQYPDINAGPAYYRHLRQDELLVTSIFHTIQGEGPFSGEPAAFIRLAGCNRGEKHHMGCEMCDTFFGFGQGARMTFDEILGKIVEYGNRYSVIVITGGEPMMQDNLTGFINHLFARIQTPVQIESNGDRLAHNWHHWNDDRWEANITIVVSPKPTQGKYRRLNDRVWEAATCLKFLIHADEANPYYDVADYAREFISSTYFPRRVFISPMTIYKRPHRPFEAASFWDPELIDYEKTRANYKRAARLALENGFCMTHQSHLLYEVE